MQPLRTLAALSLMAMTAAPAGALPTVSPDSLGVALAAGDSWTGTLTVTNPGPEALEWTLGVALDRDHEYPVPQDPPPGDLKGLHVVFDLTGHDTQLSTLRNEVVARGGSAQYSNSPPSAALLSGTDVLVVGSGEAEYWNDATYGIVRDWVFAGGTLLLSSDAEPHDRYDRMLDSLGTGIDLEPASGGEGLTTDFSPHEVTRGLTSLNLLPILRIASLPSPGFPFVRARNGNTIGALRAVGDGKVIVFADALQGSADHLTLSLQLVRWALPPRWLRVDPPGGWLLAGDSVEVSVTVTAQDLPAGSYRGGLEVADTASGHVIPIPVDLELAGSGELEVAPFRPFGTVYLGQDATREVHVLNTGAAPLAVAGVSISGADFSLDATPGTVAPGEGLTVRTGFTPVAVGAYADTIVVTTADPLRNSILVPLAADAAGPPVYSTNATPVDIALDPGQSQIRSFRIDNDGLSPLTWEVVPAASRATPKGIPRDLEGRSLGVTVGGNTGRSIAIVDVADRGMSVRTGFPILTEAPRDVMWVMPPKELSPDEVVKLAELVQGRSLLIEGWTAGVDELLTEVGSGIAFHREAGTDSGHAAAVFPHAVTFGVSELVFTGERAYLDAPPGATVLFTDESGRPAGVLETVSGTRILVTARETFVDPLYRGPDNGRLIRQTLPWLAGPTWLGVEPRRGLLGAGGSQVVTVTLDGRGGPGSVLEGAMLFRHDDPFAAPDSLPVTIRLNGTPEIEVAPASLDFGLVLAGDTAVDTLLVANPGTSELTVSSVSVDRPEYVAEPASFTVPAGDEAPVVVRFSPTTGAEFDATLTIESDAPAQPSLTLPVLGSSLPPVASFASSVGPVELRAGEVVTSPITLRNDGGSPLHFEVQVDAQRPQQRRQWTLHAAAGERATRAPNGETTMEAEPDPPALTADLLDLTGVRVLADRRHDAPYGNRYRLLRDDLRARGAEVVESADSLTTGALADYDIVWSITGLGWVPAEANALKEWVEAGGDLVLETPVYAPSNYVLSRLGTGLQAKLLEAGPIEFRPHSITEGVSEFRVGTGTFRDEGDPADVLVTNGGAPVAVLRPIGAGRVLAIVGYVSSRSTPPTGERLFMNQAFDWLAGQWAWAHPASGEIAAADSATIEIVRDSRRLPPGAYGATVRVPHDDPTQDTFTFDADCTVLDEPAVTFAPDALAFGPLLLGDAAERSVRIANPGVLTVQVTGVSIDGAAFTTNTTPFRLDPGAARDVPVAFAPGSAGDHAGTLTLTHDGPDSPIVVALTGEGLVPPGMTLEPAALVLDAPAGAPATARLTLCNEGSADDDNGGPLHFTVRPSHDLPPGRLPADRGVAKADGDEDTVPRVSLRGAGGPDALGYSWSDSDDPYGPAYEWIELDGVGAVVPFATPPDDRVSDAVPIGFAFPFYGGEYDEVTISTNGWLSFVPETASFPIGVPLPSLDAPRAVIAPFWDDLEYGRVLTHSDGERFVVEWQQTRRYGTAAGGPYTFQAILHADGRITMQYLRLNGTADRATAGIQDATGAVGLTAFHRTAGLHEGLAIRFQRNPSWLSIRPSAGVLPRGHCTNVSLSFDASSFPGDDYDLDIVVESDDPERPQAATHLTLRVPGDPVPAVDPGSLDFGAVPRGSARAETLHVRNDGPGRLYVTALHADGAEFLVPGPFTLEPAGTADVPVVFRPKAIGTAGATLVIESNDPASPMRTVPLSGQGVAPAAIDVAPAAVSASLFLQESASRPVTISNHGDVPLEWTAASALTYGRKDRAAGGGALSTTRILWPRSHGEPSASERMNTISRDVLARLATIDETTEPVTAERLSPYDIVWLYGAPSWTDGEIAALRDWVRAGGSLLLHTTTYAADGHYNPILDGIGCGIHALNASSPLVPITDIVPHPITAGVDSLVQNPVTRFTVEGPHAGILFREDGEATGAWAEVGSGRVVVISESLLRDRFAQWADNRRLGNRVFDWLAGTAWLSASPSSGTVPPGESRKVDVVMDAALLPAGAASAGLYVLANDPDHPVTEIRADVVATDPMGLSPLAIADSVGVGAAAMRTLRVHNAADTPISFAADWTRSAAPFAEVSVLETAGHGEGRVPTALQERLLDRGATFLRSSAAVTTELLAGYDVVTVVGGNDWDFDEASALVEWLREGGSLVLLSGGGPANQLLYLAGASTRYGAEPLSADWTYPVIDHEVTAAFDSLSGVTNVAPLTGVQAPAFALLRTGDDGIVGAIEPVAYGRIALFSGTVPEGWSRGWANVSAFGEGLFRWLAVPDWLSADPIEGVVAARDSVDLAVRLGGPGVRPGVYGGHVRVHAPGDTDGGLVADLSLQIGAAGTIEVVPASVAFGEVEIHETATVTLQLRNTGPGALTVSSITASPAEYAPTPADAVIPPGETRTVGVTFLSDVEGVFPGEVVIVSDDWRDPEVRVPLSATAVWTRPRIRLSATSIDFGVVGTGWTSQDTLTVFNDGTGRLNVSAAETIAPYSVTPPSFQVEPGAGWNVIVSFAPAAEGAFPAVLGVTSDDPDDPYVEVDLAGSGIAVPALTVDPDSVHVAVTGGVAGTATITLGNDGPLDRTWRIEAPRPAAAAGAASDLNGARILYDRTHGQASLASRLVLVGDLLARGAVVEEADVPLSAAALAPIDVLWVTDGSAWSPDETAAVATWYGAGGGLLLEGESSAAAFNGILTAIGAAIRFGVEPVTAAGQRVYRHPVMTGIGGLSVTVGDRLVVPPPAARLVEQGDGVPLVAAEATGGGRIVALSTQALTDALTVSVWNRACGNNAASWLLQRPLVAADPDSGTVPAGGSTAVDLLVDGHALPAGDYDTFVTLVTDDPSSPRRDVPVTVRVDGVPALVADPGAIDFGAVALGGSAQATVQIVNTGADTLHVSAIGTTTPFATDLVAVDLAPFAATFGRVTFTPPAPGVFGDQLVIESDDPSAPLLLLQLGGESDADADMLFDPAEFAATLPAGGVEADTLTISATGIGLLDWHLRIEFPHFLLDGLRILWDRSHGQDVVTHWGTLRTYLLAHGGGIVTNTAPIDAALLAGFDVLWSATPESTWTADERMAVADWVAAGGALVLEGHTALAVDEANALLETIGSGTRWTAAAGSAGMIGNVRSHMASDVLSPVYPFQLPESAAFVSQTGAQTRILFDDAGGRPAATAETIGNGRVFTCLAAEVFHNGTIPMALGSGVFQWVGSWVTMDPVRGRLPGGESVPAAITFRATRLDPGSFAANLRLESDAVSAPLVNIPLALTVTAGPLPSPPAIAGAGPSVTETLPDRFRVYAVAPNPFASSTRMRFDLPQPADTRILVYDLAGRRVRALLSGRVPAGRHEVAWDGRDEDGRQVAAGVYFYRLETGTESVTRRVVRLR